MRTVVIGHRREGHRRQGHHALVGADQPPAPLVHPPMMWSADVDKVGEISRAALGPVGEMVPVTAQIWVAQAQPYSASLAAAARESELAEVWVTALTLQPCPCRRGRLVERLSNGHTTAELGEDALD